MNIELQPQNVTLQAGEQIRFVVWNQARNQPYMHRSIKWRADGGSISEIGLYIAGTTPGEYEVAAKVRGAVATSTVTIHASEPPGSSPPPNDDPPTSDPPPSDPPPSDSPPPPPSSETMFSDGFESNDFRNWGSWAPLGDPYASAIGEGGAHIGEGWITDEMAHGGSYAWRAQVDPSTPQPESHWPAGKSSLERWGITYGEYDFTVSAWYYFPKDYPSDVWSNIMQIKQAGPVEYDPPAVIAINRDRELLLYSGLTDSNVEVSSTVVPVGRWVQIKSRFVIDRNNGQVTTWLDGQLVFDVSGINTLGHSTTNDVYFGVGNYLADDIVRCHIYIDDVLVTH